MRRPSTPWHLLPVPLNATSIAGIDRPSNRDHVSEYVLSNFTPDELRELATRVVEPALALIRTFIHTPSLQTKTGDAPTRATKDVRGVENDPGHAKERLNERN